MITAALEQCLWIGAMAAQGRVVRLEGDLSNLADELLRRFRPRARA